MDSKIYLDSPAKIRAFNNEIERLRAEMSQGDLEAYIASRYVFGTKPKTDSKPDFSSESVNLELPTGVTLEHDDCSDFDWTSNTERRGTNIHKADLYTAFTSCFLLLMLVILALGFVMGTLFR